jgi:hypothetical protein
MSQEEDCVRSYIALIPRGLHGVVEEIVRTQLSEYTFVEIELVGEEIPTSETQHAFVLDMHEKLSEPRNMDRKRRRTMSLRGTCQSPVGTVQLQENKHVSIGYRFTSRGGYDNVWTIAGQLAGTVWMKLVTNAPVIKIAQIRCLGPLLAFVDIWDNLKIAESQTLPEAEEQIERILDGLGEELLETKFRTALNVWKEHVMKDWSQRNFGGRTNRTLDNLDSLEQSLSYRMSCMRTESKKYKYGRHELLASDAVNRMIPKVLQSQWSVDLKRYDLEVVLLQRSHCLAIALALRPYQWYETRSFADGVIPPDVSEPFLSGGALSGVVRLRPTTAHILLSLARLCDGDVVLDPCAGIGTIPMEVSFLPVSVVAIGGDLAIADAKVKEVAVEYTRKGIRVRPCHRSTEIKNSVSSVAERLPPNLLAWDAASLPLRSQSVDAAVSDLPFGQQCLSSTKLDGLIPLIISEMARVLRPNTGRMVLLCGSYVPILGHFRYANAVSKETDNANETIGDVWNLPCTSVFPVNIGGHCAWVVQVTRGSAKVLPLPRHAERVKRLTWKRERTAHVMEKSGKAKTKRPQA